MEACLWPQVLWSFINDNHQAEKIQKYSQKNVRIVYNFFFCVCVCVCVCMCVYLYVSLCRLYLHIIVFGRISDA